MHWSHFACVRTPWTASETHAHGPATRYTEERLLSAHTHGPALLQSGVQLAESSAQVDNCISRRRRRHRWSAMQDPFLQRSAAAAAAAAAAAMDLTSYNYNRTMMEYFHSCKSKSCPDV